MAISSSACMGTHMKTTIELADGLLADARRVAAEEGTTLRALLEEGLRAREAYRELCLERLEGIDLLLTPTTPFVAPPAHADEVTLLEAAIRFRDLNERAPNFSWEHFRRHVSGATDEERCCRQVIQFASRRLGDSPGRNRAMSRLEDDLQDCLRRGPIRLRR